MGLLIAGLALWIAAHVFKRLAPGARAALQEKLGDGSKGIVALVLLISVVLMVIGFRGSDFEPVYDPPSWGTHLNNLLMVIAVILMGMGSSKGRMRSWLRHPMLTGVMVWAAAHLLVNGDLSSVILFATIGAWALAEIVLINAREPVWDRPAPGPAAGDIRLLVISAVVFAVIAFIHNWLGYWPFGG
ncbi:NnrU family protein [Halovulum sp. GXIMD14793]